MGWKAMGFGVDINRERRQRPRTVPILQGNDTGIQRDDTSAGFREDAESDPSQEEGYPQMATDGQQMITDSAPTPEEGYPQMAADGRRSARPPPDEEGGEAHSGLRAEYRSRGAVTESSLWQC